MNRINTEKDSEARDLAAQEADSAHRIVEALHVAKHVGMALLVAPPGPGPIRDISEALVTLAHAYAVEYKANHPEKKEP